MSAFDRTPYEADVDRRLHAWMDTQAVTDDMAGLYDNVIRTTRTSGQRPRLLVARANGATVQPSDRAWPDGRLTAIVITALLLTLAIGLGALVGGRYLWQSTTPPSPHGAFEPTGAIPESAGYLVDPALAVLQDGRVLMVGGGQDTGSALVYDPGIGTWGLPIPMHAIRQAATATTLRSGKVLITGGNDGQTGKVWATAELFDPETSSFEATGGMSVRRDFHTATLLDDGRVLIVGGHDFPDSTTDQTEIYDPVTGSFTVAGALAVGRAGHTATRLSDGRIAIIGGYSMDGPGESVDGYRVSRMVPLAEIFDPDTKTFHSVGTMLTPRAGHGAVLLAGDRILVVGGDAKQLTGTYTNGALASAELFDAGPGTFTSTASLTTERGEPSVTVLRDGRVLVAGGHNGFGHPLSAELYDPQREVFDAAGQAAGEHVLGVAPLLAGGRVFLPGGGQAPGAGSELYLPEGGRTTPEATAEPTAIPVDGPFSPVETTTIRAQHTATLLDDGRVLIVGGYGGAENGSLATAEVYDPVTGLSSPTGSMVSGRAEHVATLLPDGRVMVAGGSVGPTAAEVYDPSLDTFSPASPEVLTALRGRGVFPIDSLPPGKLGITDGEDWSSISVLDLVAGEIGPFIKGCYWRGGAVALPDGTILEGCGADGGGMLYDLATGTSQPVELGAACLRDADPADGPNGPLRRANMCEFWEPHLLPDGRVLSMTRQGGSDEGGRHGATLVYDPSTRAFTNIEPAGATSPMAGTVAQLDDGDLLMVGGNLGNLTDAARLLDVTTWEYRDIGHLLTPRTDATATTLRDGRVLIVGGADQAADRTAAVPPGAELFDPTRLR